MTLPNHTQMDPEQDPPSPTPAAAGEDEPSSLKYHIMRNGKRDYYLTTNPSVKHYNANIGPSYYVRVTSEENELAQKQQHGDDIDASFSLVILVHNYDNVDLSDAERLEQGDAGFDDKFNSSLVPIIHVTRNDGESKIAVTVLGDEGSQVWKTELQLHADPYTGKSKFVFADPWNDQWSLVGKEHIICENYRNGAAIAEMEKKKITNDKIGWLTLSESALKMLDLMIAVHMASYCFWQYEHKPSKLAAIATGLLHAESTTSGDAAQSRRRSTGFKLNLAKKISSKVNGSGGSGESHPPHTSIGGILPVAASSKKPARAPSISIVPPRSPPVRENSEDGMFSPKEAKRANTARRSFGGTGEETQAQLQKLSLVESQKSQQLELERNPHPPPRTSGSLSSQRSPTRTQPREPRSTGPVPYIQPLAPAPAVTASQHSPYPQLPTSAPAAAQRPTSMPAAPHGNSHRISALYARAEQKIMPIISSHGRSSSHSPPRPAAQASHGGQQQFGEPAARTNFQVYPELVPRNERAGRPQSMYSSGAGGLADPYGRYQK
ncbi:hypothetical protein BZA70DRAFT_162164 [Myxozyma melibiosi]|uniref:Uncharacterized protein n=1 Tax=Myxozyma melibiosi TaxID=54550 RepID=A0ABR1F6S4_9ASCO